jgi:ferredoxin
MGEVERDMRIGGKTVLVCSCDGTMAIDAGILAVAADGERPQIHHRLCAPGAETRIPADGPVLIACTQEAPLFRLAAPNASLSFVNIRETAGWSDQGADASAKIAALLAAGALDVTEPPTVSLHSGGATVILAADQTGLEAATRLAGTRPVTCLVVAGEDGPVPLPVHSFGLYAGRVAAVGGHLGTFRLTVEDLRAAPPSARHGLVFDLPVAAGTLTAEVLLDLSGRPSLFPAGRAGYVRADPAHPAAVERAIADAHALVGRFDRPRYVQVDAERCAHARTGAIGCTRCLDACPASAIAPAGNAVSVDTGACDGHGACAALCPTGAITWGRPSGAEFGERLRLLLDTYARAGGTAPRLLIHTPKRGAEIVDALARHGAGLPARVLPLAIDSVAAFGPDLLLTALSYGALQVILLVPPGEDAALDSIRTSLALCRAILDGLADDGADGLVLVDDADPDRLAAIMAGPAPAPLAPPAVHLAAGRPRERLVRAIRHLRGAGARPDAAVALPEGAPFGEVILDVDKCTLCHSCVGGCPTGALAAAPERPTLSFLENACVQCGLCRALCPEKAIRLAPRLTLDGEAGRRILKEEEPYACVRCGAPFGTRSAIERMVERLADHPMFAEPGRLDLLRMCDTCRSSQQIPPSR